MTITAKALVSAQFATATNATIYTTPVGGRTIIDKFTATNTDASPVTLSVFLVPLAQSAGASNQIIVSESIAAGASFNASILQNQILNSGDFIAVVASVGSKVVVRVSGREIT